MEGCFFPARFSGYRPTGAGQLVGGYCIAGIRDKLRVDAPDGVTIFLRAANDDPESAVGLTLYLVIPDGVSLQFLSREVTVQSPEWSGPRALTVYSITAGGPAYYEPAAVLTGSPNDAVDTFDLWLRPAGFPAASHFTVTVPAMQINGRTFEIGPVNFEAYSEWGAFTCAQ